VPPIRIDGGLKKEIHMRGRGTAGAPRIESDPGTGF
jgi:hypothetical protein